MKRMVVVVMLLCIACEKKASTSAKVNPAATQAAATTATTTTPAADLAATKAAISRGVDFLVKSRTPDGMIGGHPGVTALAVLAIAMSPDRPGKDDPRLAPSIEALARLASTDGSFSDEKYPVYTTALTLLVLQETGAHPELVAPAQAWLAGAQLDETDGTAPQALDYGGIGYNSKGEADLSNLQFALEALHESHFKDRPEVYQRALMFLMRCQNRVASNELAGTLDDGGFVYRPGDSKAGGMSSSGSMTYAGVKSFIYAGVGREDPRVLAAIDWIRRHYALDENPGLGQKGLYYYYQVFSRALALLGERELVDANGGRHDWYGDLTRALVPAQKGDGSWQNADPTYWESQPILATSRALLALDYGFPRVTP